MCFNSISIAKRFIWFFSNLRPNPDDPWSPICLQYGSCIIFSGRRIDEEGGKWWRNPIYRWKEKKFSPVHNKFSYWDALLLEGFWRISLQLLISLLITIKYYLLITIQNFMFLYHIISYHIKILNKYTNSKNLDNKFHLCY